MTHPHQYLPHPPSSPSPLVRGTGGVIVPRWRGCRGWKYSPPLTGNVIELRGRDFLFKAKPEGLTEYSPGLVALGQGFNNVLSPKRATHYLNSITLSMAGVFLGGGELLWNMRFVVCLICLLFALTARVATGGTEVKEVMAEGVSAYDDAAIARDDALKDAQRNAIEKAVGVYVESNAYSKNYQLIEDNIIAHSHGYLLPDFQVLSEGKESDGLYHVYLSAKARLGKISQDLEALDHVHKIGIIKQGGNPRIMVVVTQEDAGGVRTSSEFAVAKLSEILLSNSFEVISESRFKHNLETNQKKELLDGNTSVAARIGAEHGCEMVVIGHATVTKGKPVKIGAVTATPMNADLEISAVQADNSKVIFSKTFRSGSANSPAEAISKACKNAGDCLAGELFQSVGANVNKIEFHVKEVSYDIFERFVLDLVKVRGVLNCYARSFDEEGRSIIDVEATDQSWQIVKKLKAMLMWNFIVESITRNIVILKHKSA